MSGSERTVATCCLHVSPPVHESRGQAGSSHAPSVRLRGQDRAPIVDAVADCVRRQIYPFHTPGHKGGRFVPSELLAAWGERTLACDLPAMTATDNTLHPTGCVRDAQDLAAKLFGARETFFLVGGASQGIAAMVLAAAGPGQTIVLPRNVHRSVASALVLSGARPRFVPQAVLPECGALAFSASDLDAVLAEEPTPSAVLITRPSYYGLAADLADIVRVCHARGVPLLVDEAHGSHLKFLPPGGPQPALEAGADVVVQSCHKTLGSLVGTAMLHVGHASHVDAARVRDCLNLLQSTSPNYLMLASLDAVRRHMSRNGGELFARAVERARGLADELAAILGVHALRPATDPRLEGYRSDPLRIVVNVAQTGWTGYEVEKFLRTEYQVEDEFADYFNVVLVLSPGDDEAARERLVEGFRAVSQRVRPAKDAAALAGPHLLQPPIPPLVLSPREAVLGPVRQVPLSDAMGAVIAETVTFYPPGIPLFMPGERITPETTLVCEEHLAAGAHCYASDTTLATVKIVAANGI